MKILPWIILALMVQTGCRQSNPRKIDLDSGSAQKSDDSSKKSKQSDDAPEMVDSDEDDMSSEDDSANAAAPDLSDNPNQNKSVSDQESISDADLEEISTEWSKSAGLSNISFAASSNGGRPALIAYDAKFDPSKPMQIAVFFHGKSVLKKNVIGEGFRRAGYIKRTQKVLNAKFQRVYIFPQSDLSDNSGWMQNGESLSGLIDEAKNKLMEKLQVSKLEHVSTRLESHLSGTVALANALSSGEKANEILIMDGFFKDWSDKILSSARENSSKVYVVFTDETASAVHEAREKFKDILHGEKAKNNTPGLLPVGYLGAKVSPKAEKSKSREPSSTNSGNSSQNF